MTTPIQPRNIFVDSYETYFGKRPGVGRFTVEKLESIAEEPNWPLHSSGSFSKPRIRTINGTNGIDKK